MDSNKYEALLLRLYENNPHRCIVCGAVKLDTPYNSVKHKPDCEIVPLTKLSNERKDTNARS